jgi:hypothetical protein
MSILDELGWNKQQQEDIDSVVRNTRDSQLHSVVSMLTRTGFNEGESFIRINDHTGLRNSVCCDSVPIYDRKELRDAYYKVVKYLKLPYCCREHEEMFEGPAFEFMAEDDEDEFDFSDPDDSFDFTDPTDEDGFDFSDPTDDDSDGFDFS